MRTTLIVAICLFTATTVNADILSMFDTGLEGWTATGGALSHVNSGGNPGGFLSLADNANNYMTVYAPANLLGDMSQFLGGTLSFDARNLNGSAANLNTTPLFGTVTIEGPGGTASRVLGGTGQPPPDGLWHTYSAPLDPALWLGNLAGALSGVAQLRVVLESNNSQPAESNGFDNFRVTTPSKEVVVDVDPRATYLRAADEDSPGPEPARILELANLLPGHPVTAGDWLLLQRVGDFKFTQDPTPPDPGPHGDGTLRNLWGVFSGSGTLLDDPEALVGQKTNAILVSDPDYSRVPDAIPVDEGNAVSIPTVGDPFPEGIQPTDIPQDFVIDMEGDLANPNPVLVRVPVGATHLFLGAGDIQFFDNTLTSAPGQFGIRIAKVDPGRFVGDYNLDGMVDAADYVVWRNQLGSSGLTLAADGNADGEVTIADYDVWKNHYGQTVASLSAAGATVPEPAAWVVMLFIVAASLPLARRALA